MDDVKLRFYARGTALVSNIDAMEQGTRRFVGRKFEAVKDQPGRFAFVPTGEPEEVPYRHEYARACADGDLWPADQATADAVSKAMSCDVKFDAKFGGELPPKAKSAGDAGANKEKA